MTPRFRFLIATASLCLFAPLTATAQDYRVVYDGTITDGTDVDNVFGLSNLSSLAGLTFSAGVNYSTSIPGTRVTTGKSDEITGGLNFGTDPVVSSISFTVGGKSFLFSPNYYSDVYTSADLLSTAAFDTLGNSFLASFSPNGGSGPLSFGMPFAGAGMGDIGGAITQKSYLIAGNDNLDFNATRATVSAVPEANTWLMMLVGFCAAGFALRRRDRRISKASIIA